LYQPFLCQFKKILSQDRMVQRTQVLSVIMVLAVLLALYMIFTYRPTTAVVYEREKPVYYTTQYTRPSPVYIVDSRPYWGYGGWGLPLWGARTGYKKPYYHSDSGGSGQIGSGLPGMDGSVQPPPAPAPEPAPEPSPEPTPEPAPEAPAPPS
jgi:hypothetical protein